MSDANPFYCMSADDIQAKSHCRHHRKPSKKYLVIGCRVPVVFLDELVESLEGHVELCRPVELPKVSNDKLWLLQGLLERFLVSF